MPEIKVKTYEGSAVRLSQEALEILRGQLRGTLCFPGEPEYEKSRTIWNAMIDRHPALIVRAAGAADVRHAVDIARANGLALSVRGGGHNIAGNAVCDGGLMIDLSAMKSVRVDPVARSARVEPGVTLGEFDREAQAFALVTPLGINTTTGVAGLTLGGGFGWTSRKFGLTVDNLISADVVTADGKLLRASHQENPDLFWAIRGGGGNYGIVTSFEFRLHPFGPEVLSGLIVHPFSRARDLLKAYRAIAANSPDELSCWVVLRKAPPLPFLPADVHGSEIVIFALCYSGSLDQGKKAIEPIQAVGNPIAAAVGPQPFVGWQSAFDPLLGPGARNYWKSHDFVELGDRAVDIIAEYAGRLPSPECEIFIGHLGGAVNRVAADATAYPHRNVEFILNVHTRWRDRAQDQECVGWTRDFFNKTAPFATGGVYVNFMPEDESQRVQSGAYGANYARLAQLKQRYDPQNLFRHNQNIRPAP